MTIQKKFEKYFSVEKLTECFNQYLLKSMTTGVDNLKPRVFAKDLDFQIEIINRKVLAGNYKFTRYKEKLISKGKSSLPRVISIPTVRDRIVLKSLQLFLHDVLKDHAKFPSPQNITSIVKKSLKIPDYDMVLKLDVSKFYPSIRHDVLEKNLKKYLRSKSNDVILDLIHKAIKTGTGGDKNNELGVPQGLSISNVLAAVYFKNIDNHFLKKKGVQYCRYVDDILLLCTKINVGIVEDDLVRRGKKIGLEVHDRRKFPEKCVLLDKGDPFSYLGYQYYPEKKHIKKGRLPILSVKEASIKKIRSSLVGLFVSNKGKVMSRDNLVWKVNLRITGCFIEGQSKGWLAFFSEIDDLDLLFSLDYFVKSLAADPRFNIGVCFKSFVKTYYQLKYEKKESSYIPNFDTFALDDMKQVLKDCEINYSSFTDEKIVIEFWKLVRRETRDLETDLIPFS